MTRKTLQEILKEFDLNISNNPNYGTDKGDYKSYVDGFYENNFSPFRDQELTLVEIGVRSGASLKLWKEYFSRAKIIGIDSLRDFTVNNIPINQDWVSGDRIAYINGDAYIQTTADQVNNIDILIDDGPHTVQSHIALLELYIPKMSKNGLIIIEDINYDPNFLSRFIPEKFQKSSYVFDFGGYDNRLIVVNCKE